MEENPLVSIVVVTYNSSEFVLETLESAKSQTYQNIELIVSDDASTDNTVEICENWLTANADRFKGIKLIKSKKNTGVAPNFNRGVFASSGIWFKPIAGDDILLDNCIEYNISKIKELNHDVYVYSTPRIPFVVEEGNKVLHESQVQKRTLFFKEGITANEQFALALRNIEQPSINGIFIKKQAYVDIGGCDENFPMLEDRPLTLRLLKKGYKVYGDNEPTVLYRMHENSIYLSGKKKSLVTPWMINSYIPVRKHYFLPHYNFIEALAYQYHFMMYLFFYKTFFNKNTKLNRFLFTSLQKPFEYFRRIISYYFSGKIRSKLEKQNGSFHL